MNLTQSIRTYSYLGRPGLDLGLVDVSNPDSALLTSIDGFLTAAAADFNHRNYQSAVQQYQAASSLIYAHLDPLWDPELGLKFNVTFPRDPLLVDSLLSASSQWLNILPVPTPPSPVRPATEPAAALLASVANLHGAGLTPTTSNPAATAQAITDMKLATIYDGQGNTAARDVLITRAQGLDSSVTKQIAAANGLTIPAPAPALAAAPAPVIQPVVVSVALSSLYKSDLTKGRFPSLPAAMLPQRQVGLISETLGSLSVKTAQWAANSNPNIADIKNDLYAPHITATVLPDGLSNAVTLWDLASQLAHYYFYVIPLALGECYRALGDYPLAETCYLDAAGYAYINIAVEGPYVWVKLAELYLAWGNSSFEQGDTATALATYGKVLTVGSSTPPTTPMYTLAGLAAAATIAKNLIPQLPALATTGVGGVSPDDIAIATALLRIYARLQQINGNLDFFGIFAPSIPIWTFTYLQQVAINFAQLAQQAEQEVITYSMQLDQAMLTQAQLKSQAAQATGQIDAAKQELAQAQAQLSSYQAGLKLAQTRATDAALNATEYGQANSHAIYWASNTQAFGAGNANLNWFVPSGPATLSQLGNINATANGIADPNDGSVPAAYAQWMSGAYSQAYQIGSMNRTTTEMQQAVTQAQAEVTASQAQVAVAQANLAVAQLESSGATQVLQAFNSAVFTPQVWRNMSIALDAIFERYMSMALRAAKLMQAAFNFENDVSVSFIKNAYNSTGSVSSGSLTSAEWLMSDIQSFTDHLLLSVRSKQQLIKTSISLAGHNAYLFQTQFLKTGTMSFETTLDDFDSVFPGSYEGRIKRVRVDVQGVVPPTGISGTLTNGGISWYRLPSDIATPAIPSKVRLQDTETLVLSDYDPALDGVMDSSDSNELGIFEEAGVASTWVLSLPPALNDIDFTMLTDVVLTFLYEARFDSQLVPTVLADLATRPGYYSRERSIVLNWVYPDLFFTFLQNGTFTMPLGVGDFPTNQTAPIVTAISLIVASSATGGASGVTFSLTAPGKAAVSGPANANGIISSQGTGSPPWASAVGGSALGNWVIATVPPPPATPPAPFDLSSITTIVVTLDYTFTPRS